jgi:UDP-perosamine 4-acetyltransferase
VLGGAEQLPALRAAGVTHLLLGFYGSHAARIPAAARATAAGFELATAIHPSAVLAPSVTVGAGTVIHSGVVIEPETRIGRNVIFNCVAVAGHQCVIEDGAHIGGRSTLGGLVTVAEGALLEINVVVGRARRVGAGSVVGSMSLVLHDVPDGVVAHGIPARVVRRVDAPAGK